MPHCHITEKTRCPTHANTCPTIFLGASAPPPPPTSHLPPPSSRVLRHPRTPARRGQERRRLRFDCSPETGDQGIRISTMASISNLGCLACGRGHRTPSTTGGEKGLGSSSHHWTPSTLRILKPPLTNEASLSSQLIVSNQKTKYSASGSRSRVCMALVDERVVYQSDVAKPNRVLAYDLVQGNLVTWNSFGDKSIPDPPTAVLLHGILGSGKNWGSFARRLAQEFPMWQFLLVDLRCHGDSALIKKHRPHTVASAALDVLKLVGQLRLTPRVLVGHSFGGKVALSMVEQAAKPLARPVKVWVLDATPGKLCPGGHGEDRPGELITFLSKMPIQFPSKREVIDTLVQEGFSVDVAQWIATNLRPVNQPGSLSRSGFTWVFDLQGIMEMYNSYEETNLWEIVENVPRGVHINFLKAERSLHRWAVEDVQRIHSAEELAAEEGAGVQMHVLEDAGHWVHADNPDGLFRILASSFRGLRTQ